MRGGIQLFAGVDTELGLDVNGTPLSTTIDLEDALGLKSEVSTGRVDADLRLGRRNHILVSYFSMDRSASKSITEEIEFEDVVYEVGAEVTAKMNIDIVKASYRFDVWRDRRNELGLSIGAHTMVVELGLAGKAMVSGGGGGSVEASRSARGALPLPVVGIHFESLIARDLILRASTEALGLEFEDWGGYLIDTQVGLEWRFQRHFGLGLGYNRFVLKAWFDQDSFDGDFRYAYDGLLLNLTAAI